MTRSIVLVLSDTDAISLLHRFWWREDPGDLERVDGVIVKLRAALDGPVPDMVGDHPALNGLEL